MANVFISHECGHFLIQRKCEPDILVDLTFDKDFTIDATFDKDLIKRKFVLAMDKYVDGIDVSKKKRGRKSILNEEQTAELEYIYQTKRPHECGIGEDAKTEGWVWTVDLLWQLMRRMHPDKRISRSTAGRHLRMFKASSRNKPS
jgi:hypothetical protein